MTEKVWEGNMNFGSFIEIVYNFDQWTDFSVRNFGFEPTSSHLFAKIKINNGNNRNGPRKIIVISIFNVGFREFLFRPSLKSR